MPSPEQPPIDALEGDPEELDLFLGEATPLRAVVYARLAGETARRLAAADAADAAAAAADKAAAAAGSVGEFGVSMSGGRAPSRRRLVGRLTGPRCVHSRMLPADYQLLDQGPGPTRLARAALPDPCYWSADLPALYDVVVELQCDGRVERRWRRSVGFRRLGARGRHLLLEGIRWVLRGVNRSSAPADPLDDWRRHSAVALVDPAETPLDDRLLDDASNSGLPLVVRLHGPAANRPEEFRRLARHAAVIGLLWEPSETGTAADEPFDPRSAAPGLLLLQRYTSLDRPPEPWADVLATPAEALQERAAEFVAIGRPIVALRPLDRPVDLRTARDACDRLQRDLAPHGDFSGYVV